MNPWHIIVLFRPNGEIYGIEGTPANTFESAERLAIALQSEHHMHRYEILEATVTPGSNRTMSVSNVTRTNDWK